MTIAKFKYKYRTKIYTESKYEEQDKKKKKYLGVTTKNIINTKRAKLKTDEPQKM